MTLCRVVFHPDTLRVTFGHMADPPRPDTRLVLHVRINREGMTLLSKLAHDMGVTRSDAARHLMSLGMQRVQERPALAPKNTF